MSYQIYDLLTSSPILSVTFSFVDFSFFCAELISLIRSHLFIFAPVAVLLVSIQKIVAKTNVKEHFSCLFL